MHHRHIHIQYVNKTNSLLSSIPASYLDQTWKADKKQGSFHDILPWKASDRNDNRTHTRPWDFWQCISPTTQIHVLPSQKQLECGQWVNAQRDGHPAEQRWHPLFMWRTYCCLKSFFPIVDTCLNSEDIARQSCAMVSRWWFLGLFLRPVFWASRVQQVSDLHLKFALRPHHVWKYGRHPICGGW